MGPVRRGPANPGVGRHGRGASSRGPGAPRRLPLGPPLPALQGGAQVRDDAQGLREIKQSTTATPAAWAGPGDLASLPLALAVLGPGDPALKGPRTLCLRRLQACPALPRPALLPSHWTTPACQLPALPRSLLTSVYFQPNSRPSLPPRSPGVPAKQACWPAPRCFPCLAGPTLLRFPLPGGPFVPFPPAEIPATR